MNSKKIALVLGSGRSGTSVLTNILIALGMLGSDNMIEASEANPKGAFEDKEIFQLQREIFNVLGISGYAPLPNNFLKNADIRRYISTLREIITQRIESSEGIWGFKDPKTASLLPLWFRVFSPLKIIPKYIIAIRNPEAVVLSMNKNYNDDFDIAELAWLVRTCDALYYSGGNCFIVHYEDWFTDNAKQLATDMANFIGLSQGNSNQNIDDLLSGIVKKSLNRSSYEKYDVKNPFVKKLYAELKNCSGDQFNHERLMGVVIECRQAIKTFSPWVALTSNQFNNNDPIKEMEVLKEGNSKLLLVNNEQLKEIKELKDDSEDFRIKMSSLQKNMQSKTTKNKELRTKNKELRTKNEEFLTRNQNKDKRVQQLEKKNFMLRASVSYKIGQTFVKAISRPGVNTILLPYNFIKVILETIFVRKHVK